MTTSINELVLKLGKALTAREWKLVTAESCTGGGIAFHITEMPGSSNCFERGFVTYSNISKVECLGVLQSTLDEFGAVSEKTAREMAEGALEQSQAQISVAVTGIAGPEGGTPEKPIGTVCFAWAGINQETQSSLLLLKGDRQSIRTQSIQIALEKALEFIEK